MNHPIWNTEDNVLPESVRINTGMNIRDVEYACVNGESLRVYNEGGHCYVEVNLTDLVEWMKQNRPDLLK